MCELYTVTCKLCGGPFLIRPWDVDPRYAVCPSCVSQWRRQNDAARKEIEAQFRLKTWGARL